MSQAACPQRNQIAGYVLGTLDEDQVPQVASHLEDCPGCQAIADELDSGSDQMLEILRSPLPESSHVTEPECQRALERLTRLRQKFPWLFQPSAGAPQAAGVDLDLGAVDGSSTPRWELPRVVGEYLVLNRIGGNLGDVYKAFHLELERFEALKMLSPDLLADGGAAERFGREIAAIGRLDHPNIVRALGARRIGGQRFLAMEYVDGSDLGELVRSRGPLPIREACELARQTAVTLQYVCQQGLVHRDIKPANLMVTKSGHVKLLDLGLARFSIHLPADGETTGPGMAVGTAEYMAPEQVSDSHHVDIRADIYSLGCTLYKLLAGRAPFETTECQSTLDKLNAHLRQPVPPIKQLRPEVPTELAAVLDRMLAKNAVERFDIPEQAADALQPFTQGCDLQALLTNLGDQNILPPPPPPPRPSNRWFWELVAVAAAVLVLVIGGTMFSQWFGPIWNRSTPVAITSDDPTPDEQPSQATPLPEQHRTPEKTSAPESTAQTASAERETDNATEDSDQTATATAATPSSQGQPSAATSSKAGFAVRAKLDHPAGAYHGPPAGPDGKGELIHVQVTSNRPGYLYLLNQQADGTFICLFPNVYQADNKIGPGREITVPNPDGDFELRASPPYGTEVLVALVSLQPLEPDKFGVASLTNQQFTVVDREAVQRLLDELKKGPSTWAEARLELTTRPGSQDQSEVPETARQPAPAAPPEPVPPPSLGTPTESTPPASNEVPKPILPAPDEPPDFAPPPPPPSKASGTMRPSNQEQRGHQANEPSSVAIARQSDQPIPRGGRHLRKRRTIHGHDNTTLLRAKERARA